MSIQSIHLDQARLYRWGGVAGIAGIVVLVVSLPLAPPWPPASAETAAVVSYFSQHRAAFLAQAWVASAGAVLLVPFAAALAGLMRLRDRLHAGWTLFGAMLIFVGAFAINWIPWIEIAFRPDRPRPIIQALYDFGMLGQFVGVGMPLALFFGAAAAGTLDGAVLPRWIGWLAAALVPLNVLLAGCTSLTGVLAPSGPIGFASIGFFTVFVLACSIAMIRRGRVLFRAAR